MMSVRGEGATTARRIERLLNMGRRVTCAGLLTVIRYVLGPPMVARIETPSAV